MNAARGVLLVVSWLTVGVGTALAQDTPQKIQQRRTDTLGVLWRLQDQHRAERQSLCSDLSRSGAINEELEDFVSCLDGRMHLAMAVAEADRYNEARRGLDTLSLEWSATRLGVAAWTSGAAHLNLSRALTRVRAVRPLPELWGTAFSLSAGGSKDHLSLLLGLGPVFRRISLQPLIGLVTKPEHADLGIKATWLTELDAELMVGYTHYQGLMVGVNLFTIGRP